MSALLHPPCSAAFHRPSKCSAPQQLHSQDTKLHTPSVAAKVATVGYQRDQTTVLHVLSALVEYTALLLWIGTSWVYVWLQTTSNQLTVLPFPSMSPKRQTHNCVFPYYFKIIHLP